MEYILMFQTILLQSKVYSLLFYFQIGFGIIFQEYNYGKKSKGKKIFAFLSILWVTSSFFLVMSFGAKLKSFLVMDSYEERTRTVQDMLNKDMPIYVAGSTYTYFKSVMLQQGEDTVHAKLARQIEKKDTVVPQVYSNIKHTYTQF